MSDWGDITEDDIAAWEALSIVNFQITCSKCGTPRASEADNSFVFMDESRAAGWQVPDILENQPILCPECKKTTNFPTYLGHTP